MTIWAFAKLLDEAGAKAFVMQQRGDHWRASIRTSDGVGYIVDGRDPTEVLDHMASRLTCRKRTT